MKRTLRRLVWLYPSAWRERYGDEFEALLDEIKPTWRTLFDVLGGATKMQFKMGSAWRAVAACGVVGLLAAVGFAGRMPERYVSTAAIRINGTWTGPIQARLRAETEAVLGRRNLTKVIDEEGLYKEDRARLPIEEVTFRMRRDVAMDPIRPLRDPKGVPVGFSVSFAAPDAGQAQRTTEKLAGAFVNSNIGFLLDPASLPIRPENSRRLWVVAIGLVAGLVAGAWLALLMKLRVWKAAVGLGFGCAVLCAAVSYALPVRYESKAGVRYDAADEAGAAIRMKGLIAAVGSDESLDEMARKFQLYPGQAHAREKMRAHLSIQPVKDRRAATVRFEYRERYVAQEVAQEAVRRLREEAVRERVQERDGMVLEVTDSGSLARGPEFPGRVTAAGSGLLVGVACAVIWGMWRNYKSAQFAAG
jgi:hypothetical protein